LGINLSESAWSNYRVSPVQSTVSVPKLPRSVFENIDDASPSPVFAFPPNRETLGGTAYFIPHRNILIDAPAWNPENQRFLESQGGVRQWVLTHRGGFGKQVPKMAAALGCQVVVQEQESYLLPEVDCKTTFHYALALGEGCEVFWTAGHSPGSACIYIQENGGMLFTGRHLLPDRTGLPAPLHIAKTFHWTRQLRQVASLRDRFRADTLRWILPGASLGLLRGKMAIDGSYAKLWELDLLALAGEQARSI
jgi:glyoxylase-like metal-dependent hydrolase (beta-lactamase superfamily II)